MTRGDYRAVIFDLDGTLIDSAADVGDAVNRVLAESGFPVHPTAAYYRFMGEGVVELMRRALPGSARSPERIQAGVRAFFREYEENWYHGSRPYPGIPALLDGLSERGLRFAVLSNKPHPFTRAFVDRFLPGWRFEAVLGQRDGIPRKPDPAGAIEIADRLGLPPDAFLFLGDTPIDMKTAAAAGMLPVGACWGFRPARELTESGARLLVEHPIDLLDILCRPASLIV
ncbi:HAD family hydrolase [Desulfococcus sp.]|uniref:HAD family hydrolase n=1 Tax=Desulfococcus sp. TaxID=2025834 RepID=UPI00359431DA